MAPLSAIAEGIAGAVRLVKFDPDGFEYLDFSVTGFWRSFTAAVILAPLFFVLLVLQYLDNQHGSFVHFIAIESLAYAIAWLAFPVIMYEVCKHLDRTDNFIPLIVSYNWAALLQNTAYLPVAIMGYTGALSADLARSLALILLIWIFSVTFYITRRALDVPTATAAGVVVLEFLLSLLIEVMTNRFA